MRRLLVLAALLGFAPSAVAAVSLVGPDGRSAAYYQRVADHLNVPTVPGELTVSTDLRECGGEHMGCAVLGARRIVVDDSWRLRGDGNLWRDTVAHELGHEFDEHVLLPSDRRRFARIWGCPPASWNPPSGPGCLEWFAESYKLCALIPRITERSLDAAPVRYSYGFPGTVRETRLTCGLIRIAYRRVADR